MKKRLHLLTTFLLTLFFTQAQTTGDYRSAGNGNWDVLASWQRYNGATWVVPTVGQGYPGQNAGTPTVTIQSGHTITLNVSPAQSILNLTIETETSTLNVSGARILTVAGNWTNNGGTFSPGTGTIVFSGNNTAAINGTSGSHTFFNLTLSKGTNPISVSGNATILNVNGAFSHTTGTFNSGTAIMINVAGNFSKTGGTFNPGTGSVILNGPTQSISGTPNFYNLIISNNSASTLAGNATIAQNLLISSGTLTIGNDNTDRSLVVSGDLIIVPGAALRTIGNGGNTLSLGGALTNSGTFDLVNGAATTDITFNGSANQTISGSGGTTDFNRITVNNTGAANSNIIEVTSSAFSAAAGFLTLTDGIFKLSGSFAFSNSFFNTANPTINADEGLWLNNPNATVTGQNGTTTLAGILRISNGTYNIGTTAGNNLVCAVGATINIEGGALNIAGNLSDATSAITYNQSNGIVTVATFGNPDVLTGSFSLFAAGTSFTMSGGSIVLQCGAVLNYINFANTSSVTGGTIQFGNATTPAGQTFSIASTPSVYNLTINTTNNPTLYLGALVQLIVLNDVTIGGTLDAATLGLLLNENIVVGRNWINNGTFIRGVGTVTFNSISQGQTISGSSVTTFYNLTNSNTTASGLSLNQDAIVSNQLSLASAGNGKLTIGKYNLTINSGASIVGADANRYIVSIPTSATNGRLRQNNLSAASRIFPIGTASNYLPVTLTPGSAGSDFSMSVFRGTTGDGLPNGTPFANRTYQVDAVWRIDRVNGTANATVRFDWFVDAIEGSFFKTLTNAQIAVWRKDAPTPPPYWQLAASGFTSNNTTNFSTTASIANFGTAGTGYPYIVAYVAVLPGKLTALSATPVEKTNRIDWIYEQADQLKAFEIQESINGTDFRTIGTVLPNGTNRYSFTDPTPTQSTKYYRLKFTDRFYETSYSFVVTVHRKQQAQLTLLQNPVQGQLNFRHPVAVQASYTVTDMNGRILIRRTINNNAVLTSVETATLPKGTYILHYADGPVLQNSTFLKL